jgi:hypothetical protein
VAVLWVVPVANQLRRQLSTRPPCQPLARPRGRGSPATASCSLRVAVKNRRPGRPSGRISLRRPGRPHPLPRAGSSRPTADVTLGEIPSGTYGNCCNAAAAGPRGERGLGRHTEQFLYQRLLGNSCRIERNSRSSQKSARCFRPWRSGNDGDFRGGLGGVLESASAPGPLGSYDRPGSWLMPCRQARRLPRRGVP